MIYMDGSRFPFDAEEAVSRSIEELRGSLRKGIAAYYGIKPELITLSESREELLCALFSGNTRFAASRWDEAGKLADPACVELADNLPDMRANLSTLLSTEPGRVLLLSNPCLPTSLAVAPEDVIKLSDNRPVVVDETYALSDKQSVIGAVRAGGNITVLKKLPFAEGVCFAAGEIVCEGTEVRRERLIRASVVFEHPAAVRNAGQRLSDSADSLYLRIKKLAVKYKSLERLYRSRSGFVFFKVSRARERAAALFEMGFAVRRDEDFLCVFAGTQEEDNMVIDALSRALED